MGNISTKEKLLYFDALSTDLKKLLLCYVPDIALILADITVNINQNTKFNKFIFGKSVDSYIGSFNVVIADNHYWNHLYEEEFSKIQKVPEGQAFKYYFEALWEWMNINQLKNLLEEDYITEAMDNNTHCKLYLAVNKGWEIKFDSTLKNVPIRVAKSLELIRNAYKHSRFSIIKYLIEVKHVNVIDPKSYTLYLISNYKNFEIIKYFLEHEFIDRNDLTIILKECLNKYNYEVIDNHVIVTPIWHENPQAVKECVQFLITNGADTRILSEETRRNLNNFLNQRI